MADRSPEQNKQSVVRYQFKMNQGPSFSFLSQTSQKHPNITFNSMSQVDSKYTLNLSQLQSLTAKKEPMTDKTQVVLLLQAAEIQRLTQQLVFLRSKQQSLPPQSQKDIMYNGSSEAFIPSYDSKEGIHRQINFSVSEQNGSFSDAGKYIEKLQNKYKRALRFIQESITLRQELQAAYYQIKEELKQTKLNFQKFKVSSIRQYQLLREERDNEIKTQLSFQMNQIKSQKERLKEMLTSEQSRLLSERQNYQRQIRNEKQKLRLIQSEVDILKSQNMENKQIVQRCENRYREAVNEKENALTLASLQMQRLNSVLKDKTKRLKQLENSLQNYQSSLTASQEQASLLQRQLERFQQKNRSQEQQITRQNEEVSKLIKNNSSLNTKLTEMQLHSSEHDTNIRMKESRLQHQLKNLSQVLSKSEYTFNKQIQEYRSANNSLNRQLRQVKEQLESKEENYSRREFEITLKLKEIEAQMSRVKNELYEKIDKERRGKEELKIAINKSLLQTQRYQRQLAETTNENRRLSQLLRQQQSVDKDNHSESRIRQIEFQLREYENMIRHQQQIDVNREEQINMLKNALQQSERDKANIKRSKSFEQLFQQIQTLCSSIRHKQNQISQLKQEINNLSSISNKALSQTRSLRQMLGRAMSMIETFEGSRKDDHRSLTEEIKSLFQRQGSTLAIVQENTSSLSHKINQQKSVIEDYQNRLLDSKDNELNILRQKINNLQLDPAEKVDLDQLIKKMVSLTKQNSQLKGTTSQKQNQLSKLKKAHTDLLQEIGNSHTIFRQQLQQKEQSKKQIQKQLRQVQTQLFELKQNQLQQQSTNLQIQSLRKYNEHEIGAREQLIEELKTALRLKNDQNSKTSTVMEESIHRNSKLNDQYNQLKKAYNLQHAKGVEQIQLGRQQCQQLQREVSQLKEEIKLIEGQREKVERDNQELREEVRLLTRQLVSEQQKSKSAVAMVPPVCLQCKHHNITIKDLQLSIKGLKAELKMIKADNQAYQQQRTIRQNNYNQQMPVMNAELNRLQRIIQDLKNKNNQLLMATYDLQIKLQKQKNNKNKISVLNQELQRLQTQNVDLVQQVNVYRLELCQDANQERQLQEHCTAFVLLFAQIEAVRGRLTEKEKELAQLKKEQRRF